MTSKDITILPERLFLHGSPNPRITIYNHEDFLRFVQGLPSEGKLSALEKGMQGIDVDGTLEDLLGAITIWRETGQHKLEVVYHSNAEVYGILGPTIQLTDFNRELSPLDGKVPRIISAEGLSYDQPDNAGLKNLLLGIITGVKFGNINVLRNGNNFAALERGHDAVHVLADLSTSLADFYEGRGTPNTHIEEVMAYFPRTKLLVIGSDLPTRLQDACSNDGAMRILSAIADAATDQPLHYGKNSQQGQGAVVSSPQRSSSGVGPLIRKRLNDNLVGNNIEETIGNVMRVLHNELGLVSDTTVDPFDIGTSYAVLRERLGGDYNLDLSAPHRLEVVAGLDAFRKLMRLPELVRGSWLQTGIRGEFYVPVSEQNKNGKYADKGIIDIMYVPADHTGLAGAATDPDILAAKRVVAALPETEGLLFVENFLVTKEFLASGIEGKVPETFSLHTPTGELTVRFSDIDGIKKLSPGDRIMAISNHLVHAGDGDADYAIADVRIGEDRAYVILNNLKAEGLLASDEGQATLSRRVSDLIHYTTIGRAGSLEPTTGIRVYRGGEADLTHLTNLVSRVSTGTSKPYLVAVHFDHLWVPGENGSQPGLNMEVARRLGWIPSEWRRVPKDQREGIINEAYRRATQISHGVIDFVRERIKNGELLLYDDAQHPLTGTYTLIGIVGSPNPDPETAIRNSVFNPLMAGNGRPGIKAVLNVSGSENLRAEMGAGAYLSGSVEESPWSFSVVYRALGEDLTYGNLANLANASSNLQLVQAFAGGAISRNILSGGVHTTQEALAKQNRGRAQFQDLRTP